MYRKALKSFSRPSPLDFQKGTLIQAHCRAEGTVCQDWRYHSTFMGLTGYHLNKKTVSDLVALKQEERPDQLSQFSLKNNGLE